MLLFKFCFVLGIGTVLSRNIGKDEDRLDLLGDYDNIEKVDNKDNVRHDRMEFLKDDDYFRKGSDKEKGTDPIPTPAAGYIYKVNTIIATPEKRYASNTGWYDKTTPKPNPFWTGGWTKSNKVTPFTGTPEKHYSLNTGWYNTQKPNPCWFGASTTTGWRTTQKPNAFWAGWWTTPKPNPCWNGWYNTKGRRHRGWGTTDKYQGSYSPYTTQNPNQVLPSVPYYPYPRRLMISHGKILKKVFNTVFASLHRQGNAMTSLSDFMAKLGKRMEVLGLYNKVFKREILGIKKHIWLLNREKHKINRLIYKLSSERKKIGEFGK